MSGHRRHSGLARRLVLSGAIAMLAVGLAATRSAATSAAARMPGSRNTATAVRGRVRDITLQIDPGRRGLGAYSDTWGNNVVFDKNRDGIPDVLLSKHRQPWQIWLGNRHGGFTFDRSLPATDHHNCAVADFGGPRRKRPDGRPDLYCVRGAMNGTIDNKRNSLLIQRADGGFTDLVTSWGAVDPSGRGRTVSILHIRGNGRPSLFVGNEAGVLYPSLDHIYVNVGGRFVQAHTAGLPSERASKCSDTGDFNHDGRQDFLACSYELRLYENRTSPDRPVTYRNVAQVEGIPPMHQMDAELVDLNHDGWRDLVAVRKGALTVRLNQHRTPHFSKIDFSFPLDAGRSFCVGHANGDSAPDLLVVQGLKSPDDRLQRNDWMLINDGFGTDFTPLPVPPPPHRNGEDGNGDTCTAIPDFRGARAAWTINNGFSGSDPYSHRGYRQLVIYKP